jgi:hypothetical protein
MTIRRRLFASALALGLIIAALPMSPTAGVDQLRVFRDREFEETFGVNVDRERGTNMDFGVPLQPEDAAELHARQAAAKEYVRVRERIETRAGFAGVYIDHQHGGVPVIALRLGTDPSAFIDATSGTSRAPVVRYVDFDMAELESAAVKAAALMRDRSDIRAVGVDVAANRVVVAVAGLTPQKASDIGALSETVLVTNIDDSLGYACTSRSSCVPYQGGTKVFKSQGWCSIGFNAYNSATGARLLYTAGHCFNVGESWYHPQGTFRSSTFATTWVDYGTDSGDAAALSQPVSGNATNYVLLYPVVSRTITQSQAWRDYTIGEVQCFSGASTDDTYVCGTLLGVGITFRILRCAGCAYMDITVMRKASFSIWPGDSGGPVFFEHEAIGIVNAEYSGDTMYTHISRVLSNLANTTIYLGP